MLAWETSYIHQLPVLLMYKHFTNDMLQYQALWV